MFYSTKKKVEKKVWVNFLCRFSVFIHTENNLWPYCCVFLMWNCVSSVMRMRNEWMVKKKQYQMKKIKYNKRTTTTTTANLWQRHTHQQHKAPHIVRTINERIKIGTFLLSWFMFGDEHKRFIFVCCLVFVYVFCVWFFFVRGWVHGSIKLFCHTHINNENELTNTHAGKTN